MRSFHSVRQLRHDRSARNGGDPQINLARRNDPDLEREVGPSTRRFDRPVRMWASVTLHAVGIDVDANHQSMQLLSNSVMRGLIVEYIRNPNAPVIEQSIWTWKAQRLELIFGA